MRKTLFMFISMLITVLISASAEIKPAPVFTDNMVIQQEKDIHIWGKAIPGERVTVKFMKQTVHTTTNDKGKWSAILKPVKACNRPQSLIIKGTSGKIEFKNVLVGEVWLASGQSNIEYSMNNHPHHARPKKGRS